MNSVFILIVHFLINRYKNKVKEGKVFNYNNHYYISPLIMSSAYHNNKSKFYTSINRLPRSQFSTLTTTININSKDILDNYTKKNKLPVELLKF